MPDAAEFDALAAEFYEGWFHFHPDLALRIGLPVAGRLPPARDADERAALRGWLEELLLGLDEIDFMALDAARQLDWELMAGAARVEYRELVDHDRYGLDPLRLLPLAEVDWLARGGAGEPEALVGYRNCLTEEVAPHARGVLGCGVEHLGLRLREVHFIDCAPTTDEGPVDRILREAELALIDLGGDLGPAAVRLTGTPTAADPSGAGREGGNAAVATDPVHLGRLPRRLANAASLTVGWRLYQGHHTAHGEAGQCPQGLVDRRERLLRARLDLDLHRGRCDGDQALDTLRHHGIAGPPADALLAQIALHPGDALAGVLGWRLLERAHGLLRAEGGPTAAEFHDRLFSLGAIPLPLVLRYGFGQALWRGARTMVCGG